MSVSIAPLPCWPTWTPPLHDGSDRLALLGRADAGGGDSDHLRVHLVRARCGKRRKRKLCSSLNAKPLRCARARLCRLLGAIPGRRRGLQRAQELT
jgi:hypothetical protein